MHVSQTFSFKCAHQTTFFIFQRANVSCKLQHCWRHNGMVTTPLVRPCMRSVYGLPQQCLVSILRPCDKIWHRTIRQLWNPFAFTSTWAAILILNKGTSGLHQVTLTNAVSLNNCRSSIGCINASINAYQHCTWGRCNITTQCVLTGQYSVEYSPSLPILWTFGET